jgi:hypothetical protein
MIKMRQSICSLSPTEGDNAENVTQRSPRALSPFVALELGEGLGWGVPLLWAVDGTTTCRTKQQSQGVQGTCAHNAMNLFASNTAPHPNPSPQGGGAFKTADGP